MAVSRDPIEAAYQRYQELERLEAECKRLRAENERLKAELEQARSPLWERPK